eukprot:RCo032817
MSVRLVPQQSAGLEADPTALPLARQRAAAVAGVELLRRKPPHNGEVLPVHRNHHLRSTPEDHAEVVAEVVVPPPPPVLQHPEHGLPELYLGDRGHHSDANPAHAVAHDLGVLLQKDNLLILRFSLGDNGLDAAQGSDVVVRVHPSVVVQYKVPAHVSPLNVQVVLVPLRQEPRVVLLQQRPAGRGVPLHRRPCGVQVQPGLVGVRPVRRQGVGGNPYLVKDLRNHRRRARPMAQPKAEAKGQQKAPREPSQRCEKGHLQRRGRGRRQKQGERGREGASVVAQPVAQKAHRKELRGPAISSASKVYLRDQRRGEKENHRDRWCGSRTEEFLQKQKGAHTKARLTESGSADNRETGRINKRGEALPGLPEKMI